MSRPRRLTNDERRELGAQLLALLERRDRRRRQGAPPVVARAYGIAMVLGIRPGGSRDSRKRGVRDLINQLRKDGHDIATQGDGYFIPRPEDYQGSIDHARRSGLSHLALAAAMRHSPDRAAAQGQMEMFG